MNPVSHVCDVLPPQIVPDPAPEQIKRPEYRQTRTNQSHELLVEHDEVVGLDPLAAFAWSERDRPASRPDGNRQQALIVQAVTYFFNVLADQNGRNNLAGRLGVLTTELHSPKSPVPRGKRESRDAEKNSSFRSPEFFLPPLNSPDQVRRGSQNPG